MADVTFGGAPQNQYLSTLTPQQQQIMDGLQRNIRAAGGPVAFDPAATAKYIKQSVATPLLSAYDTTIMPRLKDAYAAVGALSSSRRGFASQQALSQLQQVIASELGKAQLQARQSAANQALAYNQLGVEAVGLQNQAIQPFSAAQTFSQGKNNPSILSPYSPPGNYGTSQVADASGGNPSYTNWLAALLSGQSTAQYDQTNSNFSGSTFGSYGGPTVNP